MYIENQYDLVQVDSNPSACFLHHGEYYRAPEDWKDVSTLTLITTTLSLL